MDSEVSHEIKSASEATDRPLIDVVDNKPLHGEIVHIQEKVLGEGRESQVFKATLKVGSREIPVVAKKAKQDRLPDDLSHGQIDEIRRALEKDGKLPMPYVYGKTPDGLLVQEYIPGTTLQKKLIENPDYLDDSKRLQLIEMALDIGSAVDKYTEGKYMLKGLSQDDILVAESNSEVQVKTEGKLICVDPSITPVIGLRGYRESTTLEDESKMFTDAIFDGTNLYDGTDFRYSFSYTPPNGEKVSRRETIDALTACFLKKPEDVTKPRQNRWDIEMLDKERAKQNFQDFCGRNKISDPKLISFLFEIYHSQTTRHFGTDEQKLDAKFNTTSKVSDFKTYFDSLS